MGLGHSPVYILTRNSTSSNSVNFPSGMKQATAGREKLIANVITMYQ